jgi:hypothetical protein
MNSSVGDVFCPAGHLISGRKTLLLLISEALFFPLQLSLRFSLRIYVFYHAENGDIYLYSAQSCALF